MGDIRLRTPQEVSDDLGGHIKVGTIRRLCRENVVTYLGADRKKILLSDDHVAAMLAYLEKPAQERAPRASESPFRSTERSKSSRRKAGN
jgi:hypothetical protein